jgi:circadian clock protein KaiC
MGKKKASEPNTAGAATNDNFLRIKTGIPGLDEQMEGGFPFPSAIMVAGGAGTGKTTFGLQYICQGAANGERGMYITTFSEPTMWMLRFASRYTFLNKDYFKDLIRYEELGPLLKQKCGVQPTYFEILEYIEEKVSDFMPKRIVIDPITVVNRMWDTGYREFLFELSMRLKTWDATVVLTGEVMPNEPYPVDVAYIVDGVIVISNPEEGGVRRRYLEVLKMRGTKHREGKLALSVTEDGLNVYSGL